MYLPDGEDLDLLAHMSICLDRQGNWPWSICVELDTPTFTIRWAAQDRTWKARRARRQDDGTYAYGYSRRQTTQMKRAMEAALVEVIERSTYSMGRAANTLGLSSLPPGAVTDPAEDASPGT